jgi:pantetheine hydrolase
MNILKFICCIFVFLKCFNCLVNSLDNDCYRAAVFEHVQQARNLSIKDSQQIIDLNLRIYETVAHQAAQHESNIIVFPEDGIFFSVRSRADVKPFLEEIPNPFDKIIYNPCDDPVGYNNSRPILYRLSCLAKNNNIYIAADMGDIQKCNQNDSKCPSDGYYQFNTAVLFDNNGNLVAKYHKMHLFGETFYNTPPTQEIISVKTPFGRFGLQICFDMIYKTPGIAAIKDVGIDTMLFPTWWFDELPFLASSQYQQSWAITNEINLLASNIQISEYGSLGSGIYSGQNGAVIYSHAADGKAKLLIADIPISSKSGAKCLANPKSINFEPLTSESKTRIYGYSSMSMKDVSQVLLKKPMDLIEKCENGFCCSLNYTLSKSAFDENDDYYLIISNRTRGGHYPWCEEFCALVKCNSNANFECHSFPYTSAKTSFTNIRLTGNFSTEYVYPSVVTNDVQLVDRNQWQFTLSNIQNISHSQLSSESFNKPLITFGLYGRCYDRDPPYVQVYNGVL